MSDKSNHRHGIFHGQFIMTEDKKFVAVGSSKPRYDAFIKSLLPGQTVEFFMEANEDTGTLTQLAKVHVCLRELGKELGYTYVEMKLEMKKNAGLCFLTTFENQEVLYCKSLADCSKEELSLMMQAIIDAGDLVGINFR